MTRCTAILLLVLAGSASAQDVSVPSKERMARLENRVAALERRVTEQDQKIAALTNQVASLVKQIASLKVAVTLQFADPTGKPISGVGIGQFVNGKQVAEYKSDERGECVVELAVK